jgi:hypothetical protein
VSAVILKPDLPKRPMPKMPVRRPHNGPPATVGWSKFSSPGARSAAVPRLELYNLSSGTKHLACEVRLTSRAGTWRFAQPLPALP